MIARTFLALFVGLFLALLPAGARAQSEALEGNWDFRIDGVTIFRFEIVKADAGEWRGTWSRPDSFATDGYAFARLRGGVEKIPSMTGIMFDGKVELSFDDPRPNAIPDIFRFDLLDYSTARMTYVGTDLAPFGMVRAGPGDRIGAWNERAIYARPRPDTVVEAQSPRPILPPARSAGGDAVVVAAEPAPAEPAPAEPSPAAEPLRVRPTTDKGARDAAPQDGSQAETSGGQGDPTTKRRRVGADFLDGL